MGFIENKKSFRLTVIMLLGLLVVLNICNNKSVSIRQMTNEELKQVEKDKVFCKIKNIKEKNENSK